MQSVVVAFRGEGAGVEDLTWGQRDVWDLMRRTGRTMNIGGAVRAAEGETLEGVAALLRFIVTRHAALRTRLTTVDGDATPRQEVHASGEIALEVVDADADAPPDAVAEAVRVRYQTRPFDPFHEWPIRMAAIRSAGTLTHVVVMYYHVVVDGFAIDAIVRDLANLGDDAAPVSGVTPLELARRQRLPSARQQSDRALRYWRAQLARLPERPPAPVNVDADPAAPRFWEVVCASPALALALRTVAASTGVASGPILLAAYARALSEATNAEAAVVQLVVSNRFRPDFAEAVGSLRQFGICVIDVSGAPFEELVARAWSATLGAHKHGYYDAAEHRRLLDETAAASPDDVDLSCYLNDRRTESRPEPSMPADPSEIRAALPRTTVTWGVREPTYDGTFYLHIEDAPDTLHYTLWGDTHRYEPAVIERCARALETTVVEAALALSPTSIIS